MIDGLERHMLLRVDPKGWRCALERAPGMAASEHAREWATRGWPVMVRRYRPDDAPELIPVAIPPPPERGKPGIAVQLRAQDVRERLPPLRLSACAGGTPAHWNQSVEQLLAIAARARIHPCVYGSLLWQTVTGLRYLVHSSDLDLIWRVARPGQATALARSIARCAATSPVRIDGEFVLPDGAGVHWREWLHGAGAGGMIVRTLYRAESRSVERLFAAHGASQPCA